VARLVVGIIQVSVTTLQRQYSPVHPSQPAPSPAPDLEPQSKPYAFSGEDRVQVVFVTVDPQRDTPERTQVYVNNFNPDFIGLSGTEEELSAVWDDYAVFRETVEGASAAGYLVNHTARVTLIDGNGNIRISFGFDTPVENIVHDLKLILKEK
jgi:cytochrome oxidase Cu insertion factor (SCO1/SenC/PrrC family)